MAKILDNMAKNPPEPAKPWALSPHHLQQWQAFSMDNEQYFLHIPSTTLVRFEAGQDFAASMKHCETGTASCFLCQWDAELPQPKPYLPQVDIRAIALNVVEACNLRCTYCFAGDGNYGYESRMDFAMAQKVINFFIRDRSDLHIIFFGGEPLLNFNVIQKVVEWCQGQADKKFTFGMTTNGVLLNAQKIAFFEAHHFQLKISYDGPLLNQSQRPAKLASQSYHQLMESKLKKYADALSKLRGLKIRATIARENLAYLQENILAILNTHQYQLAFARVSSYHKAQQFHQEDIDKLGHLLHALVDFLLNQKDFHALLRLAGIKTYVRLIHRGEFRRNFCGAGLHYLSVSTRGKFYLCHRFTEDEDECVGALETGLIAEKLQQVQRLRRHTHEPCRSCWMRHLCAGGCFYEHKAASGNIAKVDPLFCRLQEQEITAALKVYLSLLKEAPHLLESEAKV